MGCLDGRSGGGVHLLIRPGHDLVALLHRILLGTSSCVPTFTGDVAFSLDGRCALLGRGDTVSLRLLELGKPGVSSSRIRAGGDSLDSRFGLFGRERCVFDGSLLDLGDCMTC